MSHLESAEVLERLSTAGLRLTSPRRAAVAALTATERHLTAAEVLATGRRICPSLSRPTVYRTLEVLSELGMVRPLRMATGETRYALVSGGHQHLVCGGCGTVIEVSAPQLEAVGRSLAEDFSFHVAGHLLEVYGTCRRCS